MSNKLNVPNGITSPAISGLYGALIIKDVDGDGSNFYSRTNAVFGDLTFNTGTNGISYTTIDNGLQPDSSIVGIKFASLPAGEYEIVFSGGIECVSATATTGIAVWKVTDGTNDSREQLYQVYLPITALIAGGVIPEVRATIRYTSAQGTTTLKLQALTKLSSTAVITGPATGANCPLVTIKVYYRPILT